MMIAAMTVTTDKELLQILDLQRQNLRGVHHESVEKEQGFVTVTHSLPVLRQMHTIEPSIIVKDNEILAGYALTMAKECSTLVPELFSLFAGMEKLLYRGKPLTQYHFYIMGQVCVASDYRGQGVFDMLYKKHKEVFGHKYDIIITDIATRNTRSLRAHERIGFKKIKTYRDELDEWAVVVWDWT
jgi:GNAT superfamily N-acetyltransferase